MVIIGHIVKHPRSIALTATAIFNTSTLHRRVSTRYQMPSTQPNTKKLKLTPSSSSDPSTTSSTGKKLKTVKLNSSDPSSSGSSSSSKKVNPLTAVRLFLFLKINEIRLGSGSFFGAGLVWLVTVREIASVCCWGSGS
jgi:hypothetical protein